MKTKLSNNLIVLLLMALLCCRPARNEEQIRSELQSINLLRGDIALCGAGEGGFGKVSFALSCAEEARADFNLATAMLHSFEYGEAEKVFARVIDRDPECLMAYWGVAMSNFHPLWAPPTREELEKGSKTIILARSLGGENTRERDYLEAAATLYDNWENLDHKTRLLKFEAAAESIYQKYPDDKEAAIFYALALRSASDPADKTFARQRKAGDILNALFPREPDHPGVAHYLIHTYDYPELAELALPAARKYASIAAASAHALHMPSHIFTRLGLWDESVSSNLNSIAAAKCYAENAGIKGHWDEELHGIDYLVYAYLQQGKDQLAREQLDYVRAIEVAFPVSNKNAYTFAAVPSRYALERKNWAEAAALELAPKAFPWENFQWEKALVHFTRVIGAAELGKPDQANADVAELEKIHANLVAKSRAYEANQVKIQMKASEGLLAYARGDKTKAVALLEEAAAMEDATEKHPVTPGEIVPARELLGNLYMKMGEHRKALAAYEENLKRHSGRLNGLYGAGSAAIALKDHDKAKLFFGKLLEQAQSSEGMRKEVADARKWLAGV